MVYGVPGHKSLLQHETEPVTRAPGMPHCLSHLPQGVHIFLTAFVPAAPSPPPGPLCHKTPLCLGQTDQAAPGEGG